MCRQSFRTIFGASALSCPSPTWVRWNSYHFTRTSRECRVDPSSFPLIERIHQGDTAALAEYIQGRRPQLLAYISRNLGGALQSKIEAEDILQEATLESLRRIAELQERDRDPFGWLCQIAEHRIIDAHRRLIGAQKRAADREVGIGASEEDGGRTPFVNMLIASITSPSAAFSRNHKQIQIDEAMAMLPEEARDALRMRYAEGLATKDIAERLGKSDGAIRVLLTRSLSRLQAMIDV
jgi:RNA polymerase sigma-70 factor (ECF subfamily)